MKHAPLIDEVVFADDFFRSREMGMVPASMVNRRFLRALFGTAASRLGWRIRDICPQSQGGTVPVDSVRQTLGLPPTPDGWAAAGITDLSIAADDLRGLDLTPASLVIGWGLPPSLLRYIDTLGAAFIDLELHAIRYAANLHLVARTNDLGIERELEGLRIDEEDFWAAAAGLRGYFALKGQTSIVRPNLRVGLFAGQMQVDSALIRDGRVARPADFLADISDWAKEVDILAVRPHPGEPDPAHLDEILRGIPNAVLLNSNTYGLLCAENLAFVSAISSGVLKEAPYLGCRDVRRLIVEDRNSPDHLPATCSQWIPVKLELASMRSLRAISHARLGTWQWPLQPTRPPHASSFSDDMLNTIFGYRWGFSPTAPGLPELPALRLAETASIAADAAGGEWMTFGYGWHPAESWGVWTAAAVARLPIPLELPPAHRQAGSIELVLHGHPFAPGDASPPSIRILVDGLECRFQPAIGGGMDWTVSLPATSIERGLVVVQVEVSGALRACDVGGTPGDTRTFGLGLRTAALRDVNTH